jgi:hypothetical protein
VGTIFGYWLLGVESEILMMGILWGGVKIGFWWFWG